MGMVQSPMLSMLQSEVLNFRSGEGQSVDEQFAPLFIPFNFIQQCVAHIVVLFGHIANQFAEFLLSVRFQILFQSSTRRTVHQNVVVPDNGVRAIGWSAIHQIHSRRRRHVHRRPCAVQVALWCNRIVGERTPWRTLVMMGRRNHLTQMTGGYGW